MKRVLLSLVLLMGVSLLWAGPKDEEVKKAKKSLLDAVKNNSSALGRQFVVAFPPDYNETHTKQALDIYVASGEDTEVCIRNEYFSLERCLPVKAGEITTFTTENQTSSWAWELWQDERPIEFGFEISADAPISVYVMISKAQTSEGYMAIPVSAWGKKYMHNNLYHWRTGSWNFSSGFVIISNSDDTRVNIDFRGKGEGYGTTKTKKRDIGDRETITLKKHQVYMVLTESMLENGYDLSGTMLTSNKPIGLISFHQIVWLPTSCGAGDNIVSMMPPIEAWGKEYATVELERGTDKGDYMRVFAAEDNTKVTITSYDIATGNVLTAHDATLNESDYWDYNSANINGHCNNKSITGVRGLTVIKADKPIYAQQYAYSAQWDCVSLANFDPFTFPITAREQYTDQTIFQTPYNKSSDNEFNNNYFNLLVIGEPDSAEKHQRMMNSITLDGEPLRAIDAAFGTRRIPGTDYYWGRFKVENGPHTIKADEDTKFGAYIYGFSDWDSYAWPAATNYDNLEEIDTLPPVLDIQEVANECGVWRIRATEFRTFEEGDPLQVDQGFGYPPFAARNVNFLDPVLVDDRGRPTTIEDFPIPGVYDYYWEFRVADMTQDASFVGWFQDQSTNPGINITEFDLAYSADRLDIDPTKQVFGDIKVGETSPNMDFTIEITSDEFSGIESIELLYGTVFQIVAGATPPANLKKGDTHIVTVSYSPTMPYQETEFGMDIDTLIVKTSCAEFSADMEGRGVQSAISVSDFINNQIRPGQSICSDEKPSGNIKITNFGTDAVIISGIAKVQNMITGDIVYDDPANPITDWTQLDNLIPEFEVTPVAEGAQPFDLTITPSTDNNPSVITVAQVCFSQTDLEQFRYEVTFASNTTEGDHVSIWDGEVFDAALQFNDLSWGKERVGTWNMDNTVTAEVEKGMVTIWNTGNAELRVKSVAVVDDNGDPHTEFFIDDDRNDALDPEFQIVGQPAGRDLCPQGEDCGTQATDRLLVPIRFTPLEDALRQDNITGRLAIVFDDGVNGDQTVYADLDGKSFLPKYEPSDEDDFQAIFGGFTSNGTATVTIENTGYGSDTDFLKVYDFVITGNGVNEITSTTDFGNFTSGTPLEIAPGKSETFTFNFTAPAGNADADYSITIEATHDGLLGTQTERNPVIQNAFVANIVANRMSADASSAGIDFGPNSSCVANPTELTQFTNNSEASVEYSSIIFSDPAQAMYFEIDETGLAGQRLAQNENVYIPVTFRADLWDTQNGEIVAPFVIEYNAYDDENNMIVLQTDQYEFRGSTFGYELSYSIDSPNAKFTPGEELYGHATGGENADRNVDIRVSSVSSPGTNFWADNQITELKISLTYNSDELYAIPVADAKAQQARLIPANSVIQGWDIVEMKVTDNTPLFPGLHVLEITVRGTQPISQDGVLMSMPFVTLLHEDLNVSMTLVDIEGLGTSCVVPEPGVVVANAELDYCEQDVRAVALNPTANVNVSIQPISPNPISTDMFTVDYSTTFGDQVTMEIVSSEGKVLDTPVNEVMYGGHHSVDISTSYLPSGTHFLTLKANGEVITQQIVVVK